MASKAVAREAMIVAQISKPGGDFEVVERQIPDPGTGQVRIKIQACVFVTVTCSQKKVSGRGLSIPRGQEYEAQHIAGQHTQHWSHSREPRLMRRGNSSTMMVMTIAITASLNASTRAVVIR